MQNITMNALKRFIFTELKSHLNNLHGNAFRSIYGLEYIRGDDFVSKWSIQNVWFRSGVFNSFVHHTWYQWVLALKCPTDNNNAVNGSTCNTSSLFAPNAQKVTTVYRFRWTYVALRRLFRWIYVHISERRDVLTIPCTAQKHRYETNCSLLCSCVSYNSVTHSSDYSCEHTFVCYYHKHTANVADSHCACFVRNRGRL